MVYCEICGSEKNLVEAIVEGVILTVCEDCAKYGKVVKVKKLDQPKKREVKIRVEPEVTYEIVSDYASIIKISRERRGLKQDELALKISEKASEIHNLESGKLKPSFNLARKLEKFFGIKLIEEMIDDKSTRINLKDKEITIGDLIKFKKSKNE